MTTTKPPAHLIRPARGRARRALAAVAVAATLPYLTLKVLWLAGVPVGVRDDLTGSGVMAVANGATLFMEFVAAALAVAFVVPAGRRLPGAVVQVPMAVGSGLLGGILVIVPVQLALTTLRPSPTATPPPSGIANWVYALVYGGFVILGLSLLTLYAAYVRDRWGRPGRWELPLRAWRGVRQRAGLAAAAVALVVLAAGALLASFDSVGVVTAHPVAILLLAGVAAAGLLALLTRRPRRLPGTAALAAAWWGGSAVAAWSTYVAALLLVPNPLRGDGPAPTLLAALEMGCAVCGWWIVVRLHGDVGAPGDEPTGDAR